MRHSGLYFDKQDRDMLAIINRVLSDPETRADAIFLDAQLHPHGIKGLVVSPIFRVAYAVINLLTKLEAGQASDRLRALQSLYDEVLASAHSTLRRNTARVLLQIMKELVRAHGDEHAQLKLVHDFRQAAQGTPRVVRHMLARYHLPELSEDWDQLAFDDHVHDANTRGRKSPTHLIMDAWIKGLRSLTVVYYNYLEPQAAREVLEAAAIVGIDVRIALEFQAPFRTGRPRFIWAPRGFTDTPTFLEFLTKPAVMSLMQRGLQVVHYQRQQVLQVLDYWNTHHRRELETCWELPVPALDAEKFLHFVEPGQPSLVHLAEYIHQTILPVMRQRATVLYRQMEDPACAATASHELERLDRFGYESITDTWLSRNSPAIRHVLQHQEHDTLPELLRLPPAELAAELASVHPSYRLILNLADLDTSDVLELLWDCEGHITHLEIFNLKNWSEGRLQHLEAINELREVINNGSGPRIKQIIRKMIQHMEETGECARRDKFRIILRNVPTLLEYYHTTPLKCRMGSNSTSRTSRNFGMGLVFPQTLPSRAQAALQRQNAWTTPIPIYGQLEERIVYTEPGESGEENRLFSVVRKLPGCRHVGCQRRRNWTLPRASCHVTPQGNLSSLGGLNINHTNGLLERNGKDRSPLPGIRYLNTTITNILKVLVGFLPSVFSFWYTQEWWFLIWFGTPIWFAITGIRNIIQMVMAGQGFTHNSLLRWKDHVSLNRICDSLMYTGISVLLLEVMVRVWLLEDLCGISVRDQPILVFTVLNVVNAVYICAHNIYRGFPREAAIGNIFRSALAIPVSYLYNDALFYLLLFCGMPDPLYALAPSASIISKLASDTVAAAIEGYADSQNNMRMRRWDYQSKISRIFASYTRLELLYPEEDVLIALARKGGLGNRMTDKAHQLERTMIIDALDCMYFWFYQPRAQDTLRTLVRSMSQADRTVFMRSQLILMRSKELSQLFVDGLVGSNFSRPLAFYLNRRQEYLRAMSRLCLPRKTGRQPRHSD